MARDLSRGRVVVKKFMVLVDEYRGHETVGTYQVNITIDNPAQVRVSFGVDEGGYDIVDVIAPDDIPEEWIEELAREQLEKFFEEKDREARHEARAQKEVR